MSQAPNDDRVEQLLDKINKAFAGAADKITEAAEKLSQAGKPDSQLPKFIASDGTQAPDKVVRAVLEGDQEAVIRNIDRNIQRLVDKADDRQ